MTLIDRRRRGFFMIDNEIVDDARLTHKEMAVYMVLCRHLNQETGSCFPSLPTIGKKVGMSKNTVIKALNTLIEIGYVTKEKRSSKEQGDMSNVYYVNDVHDLNGGVHQMNRGGSGDERGGVHEVNPNNTNLNNTNLTISSSSSKNPFSFYESNIGVLNPFMADGIDQWIKDTSEELVIAAMERALKQQKKWNYAEGILKQWANKNIKTLNDVEALEAEYQRNKGAKNNAESGTSNTNRYSQKGEYDYGF
ncbi:DnaD domain protein (plasmid) [Bacillus tropicus]|uniref:helix-turn-helix domain-containing protein n=1 Tax=Bacillus cereus group TaxID=86661 RepID=UPI0013E0847C|nr:MULTISPECIES: helix-turn-helix domain-containing protein [Bacillus cereus group]MDK7418622.1 DnaD domain protein [Bacillus paranthracis]MDK7430163.1 DnaD domain protein [Bacillus paranthracis]MDK7519030.1 DnaD domain protein [Bacillus paranthracis]MDK7571755.1 DnaD domain protein [Bacillus paranthracis]QIE40428.1 DnaD domain protein [Bacillus tropicus]